jgi:Ca-activated chloride channel family protein
MRFANPEYLLCLLFIIPLLVFYKRKEAGVHFSSIELLKQIKTKNRFNARMVLTVFRVLTMILFVVALARPQTGKRFSEIPSAGIDIILAIDTSDSMMGLDFKIDGKPTPRITVVKNVATEFVKQRSGDRIGVVVFGSEAFTQVPLTLDHGIVIDFISKIKSGMAGGATAVGSGLGTAIARMQGTTGKSKVVILLTDGVNNSGRIPPLVAAEIATHFNIKVYTIGAGSKGQIPFRVETPLGAQLIYREGDLDEETLKRIAEKTGGKYFKATDTDSLKRTYREIDALEKTEIKVKEYTEYTELFHWFLIPGIIVLLIEIILGNTILRKFP